MKALFLDRDGVINVRIVGRYVTTPEEMNIIPGVYEALRIFRKHFDVILVATNQQGIGKKLMTHKELDIVHAVMEKKLQFKFDGIYYCPILEEYRPFCRKPQPGMAYQALKDFPAINFKKSVMVGDMDTDMQFAKAMNMHAVQVGHLPISEYADEDYEDLLAYANEFSIRG